MDDTEDWDELRWDQIPYLCIDTETTGFSAEDRICEIALVVAKAGEVIEHWTSRINPERPIDPGASAAHGLYDEDVADAPTWDTVFPQIRPFFFRDIPWVAHNMPFDARMISYSWSPTEWPRGVPTLCTLDYSKHRHPTTSRRRFHKLPQLANYFDVEYDPAELHDALYDTVLLAKILPKLMGRRFIGPTKSRYSHEWRK